MPLTVTLDRDNHVPMGTLVRVTGTIDFDSSYLNGGEALSARSLGLRLIHNIELMPNEGAYFEVRNALPATSVDVRVMCPSGGAAPSSLAAPTAAAPTMSGADSTTITTHTHTHVGGIGVELANAADASTLAGVRFVALGV